MSPSFTAYTASCFSTLNWIRIYLLSAVNTIPWPASPPARSEVLTFLDRVGLYTIEPGMILGSMPARHWWDVEWWKQQHGDVFVHDSRPGASPNNVWSDAIESARDTATNPAVLDAFALAIVANGQGGYRYPGVRGHEPDVVAARKSREQVHRSMNELRVLAPDGGSYVSESNFFEEDWQHSYWGPNYARLASVKEKYDPSGLFFVHNGVGSEAWSADGFTKV